MPRLEHAELTELLMVDGGQVNASPGRKVDNGDLAALTLTHVSCPWSAMVTLRNPATRKACKSDGSIHIAHYAHQ